MRCSKAEISTRDLAEILKKGGIAVLPTDTVYGFSGIVESGIEKKYSTDEKIRKIKGRSETKPMIELISSPSDISLLTDDKIPSSILEKWPGALTVIVNVKKGLFLENGLKTVAVRCPGDPWLRELISFCSAPLFSTSVNRSGKKVLESIDEIEREFGNEADIIIDDGDRRGALPSTIVSLLDGDVKVLRQGNVIV